MLFVIIYTGGNMKYFPLKSSFMIVSIVGVLVSLIWLWKYDKTWAFALIILFVAMLCASLLSMSKASPEQQLR